ncbi:VOC family protein [Paenibacillus lutimineralis]|uniref:VOC family protein n=1 Tax=Paenibacillus lutimineralis TaxID=2707005 RepID=A0A3Q9I897_9BACL|nr:VOC family protein [Paenibacillus lutimineralis]AZS15020.1 VOC family protein [Paenibacillus lutimineralis]
MSIVTSKISGIFIPVKDITAARDWYCSLLGLEPDLEIISGHLCCIPMDNNGLNVILDSKVYAEDTYARTPMFHFDTDDIERAYQYVQQLGAELVTSIEHGHWFNFKDPDGNMLMICKCN